MSHSPIANPTANGWTAPPALFKDKAILVTGAGAGIGRQAAITFAASGATVILLGRTLKGLEATYDAITAAGHAEPFIYELDLEKAGTDDYSTLADAVRSEFGRLDGLLLNASVLGQRTPISNYSPIAWQSCMQINLTANFLLVQNLLELLSQADNGRILFTSSSVGREGRAYWGAYAVSKFGTEGLMQVLADEIENTTTLRVNSVNPGATRTNMRASAYPGENPESVKHPEALMDLYCYLMSEHSGDLNGQMIDF